MVLTITVYFQTKVRAVDTAGMLSERDSDREVQQVQAPSSLRIKTRPENQGGNCPKQGELVLCD